MSESGREPPVLPHGARRTPRGDFLAVFDTPEDLAAGAAGYLAALLAHAIKRRGRALAALAGGRTPGPAYAELGRRDLDWDRIDFLLTDERLVPAEHPESNYRMIRKHLGPAPRIWPMVPPGATPLLVAGALARAYARRIEALAPRGESGIPALDLAVLGLGRDGHVASLFPGSSALEEAMAWVVPAPGPAREETGTPARDRLTLGPVLLNHSGIRILLVAGPEKSASTGAGLAHHPRLPVTCLQAGAGPLVWMIDADAAGHVAGTRA